eukprot:Gb_27576 [translate_table: standard]
MKHKPEIHGEKQKCRQRGSAHSFEASDIAKGLSSNVPCCTQCDEINCHGNNSRQRGYCFPELYHAVYRAVKSITKGITAVKKDITKLLKSVQVVWKHAGRHQYTVYCHGSHPPAAFLPQQKSDTSATTAMKDSGILHRDRKQFGNQNSIILTVQDWKTGRKQKYIEPVDPVHVLTLLKCCCTDSQLGTPTVNRTEICKRRLVPAMVVKSDCNCIGCNMMHADIIVVVDMNENRRKCSWATLTAILYSMEMP